MRSAIDRVINLWSNVTLSLGYDVYVSFIWVIITFIALSLITKIFYRGAQK